MTIKQCLHCNKDFEGTTRAKFCSDNCRKYFHARGKFVPAAVVTASVVIEEGKNGELKYYDTDVPMSDLDMALVLDMPTFYQFEDKTFDRVCPSCNAKFQTRLKSAKICLQCREAMLDKKYKPVGEPK